MGSGAMTRAKVPTESAEQHVLVDALRWAGIGCFSVPNGAVLGGRDKFALLQKLRNEGLLAGAPDLVLMDRAPDGKPVAIEMKRRKGARSEMAQRVVHDAMRNRGWVVIVAKGAEDALGQLYQLGFAVIRSVLG